MDRGYGLWPMGLKMQRLGDTEHLAGIVMASRLSSVAL